MATITGSFNSLVSGTLSGTIGTPGPAGATGATGATGAAGAPGSPGVGVPAAGSTGQVLQKLSSTSYDTGWLTLPADFITSVTAPLAVTSGDLTVDLSDYLPLSGGTLDANSTITASTATVNSLFAGDAFGLELSANPSENASLQYNGVQVQNAIGTMSVTSSGLTFPDLSTQTVAYPGSTGFLLKANNLSGLADTSVSRTNLGLGTMATATAADYSTTTVANGLYYPLSGNPSAFLVAADITGKANLASPTFTGTPTLPTGTIGVTQSPGNNTTALATTAFVTTADNLKANLASPTFTGTPTLPTGTIGTTQSPGNNTTALATTAFVTAAVPLVATFAESQQLTSATAFMSPFDTLIAMMTEGYRPALGMSGGSTGTGAGVNPIMPQYMGIGGPNTLTAGNCYAVTNVNGAYSTASTSIQTIKWNKPVCISGTFNAAGALVGEANNEFKIFLGTSMTNGDDPTSASIGLFKLGGTTPISVMVHNGTTLTKVASSGSFGGTTPVRYLVYSDGNGNVTLYINGTSVATTALGPTGATQTNIGQFTASIKQTASAATRYYVELVHPKIFVAPQ